MAILNALIFYWDKGIVRDLKSWDLSINSYDDPPPLIKKVPTF